MTAGLYGPPMRGARADRSRNRARSDNREERWHVDIPNRARRQSGLAEAGNDEADRAGHGNRQAERRRRRDASAHIDVAGRRKRDQ
jgi:hypothetical protein